jgi:hypothetical protein
MEGAGEGKNECEKEEMKEDSFLNVFGDGLVLLLYFLGLYSLSVFVRSLKNLKTLKITMF